MMMQQQLNATKQQINASADNSIRELQNQGNVEGQKEAMIQQLMATKQQILEGGGANEMQEM